MKKICNRCAKLKSLRHYGKDSRNKDGLQGICEDCRRIAKQKIRAQRLAGQNIHPVEKKTCNGCDIEKLASDFYRDAGIADGRSTICKICREKSSQRWRENNREHYNATMRAYNKKHYKRLRLQRYKLSLNEYEAMLIKQRGKCAVCEKNPGGKRPLVVDHNHKTGMVRGLLCYGCNRLIAFLDNPQALKWAEDFLKSKS